MKNSIQHLVAILLIILYSGLIHSNAQNKQKGEVTQFVFSEFTDGIIKNKRGKIQNSLLNYNTVTQKMVFSQDGGLFDLTGTELIDTIIIKNRKFVPFNDVFYEVLVVAPVSLFLQHKSKLVPVGSPAGYGSTSQTSAIDNYVGISTNSGTLNLKIPDEYEISPEPVYWVVDISNKVSFINRNQFMKIFSPEREKLENFIKKNKIKFENPGDVARLINYYNEIK